MKKSIVTVFALAACLVACNKNEVPVNNPESQVVRFKVSNLNTYTVKAAGLNENELSDVKVIAGAPINKTASGSVDGNTLTVSPALYWQQGQTLSTKFVAITGNQSSIVVDNYNVLSGEYDYAYCAKLMSASATVAPGNEVSLDFYHIFSKLIINIQNNLGADYVKTVTVSNFSASGSVNFETREVNVTGAYTSSANAHQVMANNIYAFALLPQTAAPTITVETNLGAIYTFVMDPDNPFEFLGGKCASVDLTIGAASSDAGGTSSAVGVISINSVNNWDDDDTDVEGNGTVSFSDNYWYIRGTINDSNWSKVFPMTMTGTNIWETDFTYNKTGLNDEGFKLHLTPGWGSTQLGADPANKVFPADGTMTYGWKENNDNIQLAASGSYHIRYDFNDGDKVYITVNE